MIESIIAPLITGFLIMIPLAIALYILVKICKKYPKVDFGIGIMIMVIGILALAFLIGLMIENGFLKL